MMTRVPHCVGLLTAIGLLIGAAPDLQAAETKAGAPAKHHVYLHVVAPKDGEPVQVTVLPHEQSEPATDSEPVDTREETELEALIDEVPLEEDSEADAEAPVLEEITPPAGDAAEEEPALAPAPPLTMPPAEESLVLEESERGAPMGLLLFIFVLAIFLGFELISKVPSQLHTPLMSGSNAISGITIVGALAAAGLGVGGAFGTFLGTLAVTFATINVVGGYMVTNRMLAMFKKKDGGQK